MKRDHTNTLLLPFEQGILGSPSPEKPWLFLNAENLPNQSMIESLKCEQHMRPGFVALERAGYFVSTEVKDEGFAGAFIVAGRNRKVNEANIARAHNAVVEGAFVIVTGDKTSGIQSLRKRFKGLQPESLSKNHAVVFWFLRTGKDLPVANLSLQVGEYQLAAGMFSANGPDKGSQLLVQNFDDRIFGKVADFGAGWGYLSAELLKKSDRVESVDLFEADFQALEAAKKNVADKAGFHWCDLTAEAPRGPYNWIIMNPPFHTGRAAEPNLGTSFIQKAAKSLPAGGRLLMVANTNLPYEKTLEAAFKKVERKAQANGFKVIEAVR